MIGARTVGGARSEAGAGSYARRAAARSPGVARGSDAPPPRPRSPSEYLNAQRRAARPGRNRLRGAVPFRHASRPGMRRLWGPNR